MSSLDTIDNVFYLIKKYILPVVFLTAGFYLLYLAMTPVTVEVQNQATKEIEPVVIRQQKIFMYAALILLLGSVVWILFLLNVIKSKVGYAIMGLMVIGSSVVLYLDYKVVQEEVEFREKYSERTIEIQTRLMDIKAAEVAYREVNGVYTDSFDDLINFIKNGKKMDFIKNGSIPERQITVEERDLIYGDNRPIDFLMNEEEATNLARRNGGKLDGKEFQRDTIFVGVMDAIFKSERYLTGREKFGGQIDFHPDSLRYVPFSENEVELDTASVDKGEFSVPTLRIAMTHPMKHPLDGFVVYSIGAIDDNHLRESWDK